MVNVVILQGNLTKDVETRTVGNTTVCNLVLANNQRSKDKEYTNFIDVECWGKLAETCGKYLSKGSKVLVDGQLIQQSWDTDNGKRFKVFVRANSVDFLSSKITAGPGNETESNEFIDNRVNEDDVPF